MSADHGFTTREEWNTAFTEYFSQIQRINQLSYQLLNKKSSFSVWMKEYQEQSETIFQIFQSMNAFLNNHIRYFEQHPTALTETISDSLLSYLYRYCMRMEDTEAVYIAVQMLMKYYEERNNEIAVMKCCFVFSVLYMFLDIYNFSEICLSYNQRGMALYEKHYDELDEETKSMGISFYDTCCSVLGASLNIHDGFSQYFDNVLKRQLETGLDMIDRFMKEADMSKGVNQLLPLIKEEMEESFITMTFKIPKYYLTSEQIEYIADITKSYCKAQGELKDDVKSWKARLSLMMAKRLTEEMNYEEIFEAIHELLQKIPDMYITKKEEYNDFVLDLLCAFSNSFQTLIKEQKTEGNTEIGVEILRKLSLFISSLPYEKYLQHTADESVFHEVLTLIRFLPDEQTMIDSVLRLTIYRQLQTAIHTKMVARSADIITKHLLKEYPQFFLEMPFFDSVSDVLVYEEEIKRHVHNGAMLHDVGKILCTNVINMQYRKITGIEFETIKFHPATSGKILSDIPLLSQYYDIAVGHHKSFDGLNYPQDFDNLHSPQKILIDLITVCDSLDAATDTYGRIYAKTKTFEEVMQELNDEKGTRYSDTIVDFIQNNQNLYHELKDLFTSRREEVYQEVHEILHMSST